MTEEQKKNKELIEKYPFLLPRSVWTGEPLDDYDYSYTELDEIPGAWKDVYGLLICDDLVRTLGDYVDKFMFVEIKEKWGELRLYDNGATKEWSDQLWKYEHLTANTCYKCGKIGVPITDTGWYLPLCKECYEKQRFHSTPYEEYLEDYEFNTIVRVKSWSRDDGERIVEHDCCDILRRVDPKYLTDEVKKFL